MIHVRLLVVLKDHGVESLLGERCHIPKALVLEGAGVQPERRANPLLVALMIHVRLLVVLKDHGVDTHSTLFRSLLPGGCCNLLSFSRTWSVTTIHGVTA